jgi:predicted  nucleic acid-binding Zn ribbon protein
LFPPPHFLIGYKGSKANEDQEEVKSLSKKGRDRMEGEAAAVGEEVWYYHNRVTGHSLWEQPQGWLDVAEEAGGWILCAEEVSIEDMYW